MSEQHGTARRLGLAMILAVVAGGGAPVSAGELCSEEGTWEGAADNGFTWLNIITSGSDATRGQLDLAWVTVDPTLGGAFTTASRVSPGRGAWQKVSGHIALWTWIAYGLDAGGARVYTIRASGTHTMTDCDHLEIAYSLQIFLPFQDMATDSPIACLVGTARETRMLQVQASCGS